MAFFNRIIIVCMIASINAPIHAAVMNVSDATSLLGWQASPVMLSQSTTTAARQAQVQKAYQVLMTLGINRCGQLETLRMNKLSTDLKALGLVCDKYSQKLDQANKNLVTLEAAIEKQGGQQIELSDVPAAQQFQVTSGTKAVVAPVTQDPLVKQVYTIKATVTKAEIAAKASFQLLKAKMSALTTKMQTVEQNLLAIKTAVEGTSGVTIPLMAVYQIAASQANIATTGQSSMATPAPSSSFPDDSDDATSEVQQELTNFGTWCGHHEKKMRKSINTSNDAFYDLQRRVDALLENCALVTAVSKVFTAPATN